MTFGENTLNHFIKKGKDYTSINLMIQTEFCHTTLTQYIKTRNESDGSSKFTSDGGVIDRQKNLKYFSQIIEGMIEVHDKEVVHRDLKPDNIFIE